MHPSLIPMLPVRNLAASVDFYQRLGFGVVRRRDDWGWAMLEFGNSRLMLDQSINACPDAPRLGVIYLYTEDIAGMHNALCTAGIQAPAPDLTFYGHTEFRIEDPDGNRLWIGQPPRSHDTAG